MRVCDLGVVDPLVAVPIELLNRIHAGLLQRVGYAGRIPHVGNWLAVRAEFDALKLAGQKARTPLAARDRLVRFATADAREHNKPGQVVGLRPQSIRDPSSHRRPAADRRAAIHERVGRVVVDLFGDHRADDADVVGDFLVPRQQVADRLPTLAAAAVLEHGGERPQLLALKLGDGLPFGVRLGHRLTVKLVQRRLVVERFEMRRPTGHAQKNHALRLGGQVWQPGEAAIAGRQARAGERGAILANHHCKRGGPDAHTQFRKERAALDRGGQRMEGIQLHYVSSPFGSARRRSITGDGFVHIEHRAGHQGPRGQFGFVQRFGARDRPIPKSCSTASRCAP